MLDAEAAADWAATEIAVLVRQGLLNPIEPRKSGNEHEDSSDRRDDIAANLRDRTEFTGQADDGIPEWVMAESTALSREVPPPGTPLFSRSRERQDEDCGPAAVVVTIYYIYCKTGIKREAFESLLTYAGICQYATTHLQQ